MQTCPSECGYKTNRSGGIGDHLKAHPACIPGRKIRVFKGGNQAPKKKAENGNGNGGGKKGRN